MKLESIFGEGNASSNETDLLSYSTDASMRFGKAKAVAWPSNSDQVRKLMVYASQEKLNIVPRGAGTGLSRAVIPDDSIVLDFSRISNILEVSISGRYCIVEPGVVVDDLNAVLSPNLYYPVIPSSDRKSVV